MFSNYFLKYKFKTNKKQHKNLKIYNILKDFTI